MTKAFLVLSLTTSFFAGSLFAQQTNIIGPAGSEQFGQQVINLPNGNFVVTDPSYDAGALVDVGRVYLYNGTTLALINTITGVSAGDFVGNNFSGRGVTVLAGGDYVVTSSQWNGGRGAVTRCSATSGCPASISAANSLVGTTANDNVGGDGVTALPSGNYAVRSSQWDNGAINEVGAITWCPAAGCTGAVTTVNSRYGSTPMDQIGLIGVIVLSNGNYVTNDVFWDNGAATDAGAVTFCLGTAPCTGAVSIANSLIGTTASEYNGNSGIFPLGNGNYVVCNGGFDNGATADVGAATFCNGTTGCTATVSAANSLRGTTANDQVGLSGIKVLTNNNYVVSSLLWDNGAVNDAGAATFCNGTTGCIGVTVTTGNSLHGTTAVDEVSGFGSIVPLSNGNYVVASPVWNHAADGEFDNGAVTFCNGTSGCSGPVTPGNSLIGDLSGTRTGTPTALTNGNYVVSSSNWLNPIAGFASAAGAVTFCNGTSGCVGMTVDASNSLVGTTANDQAGRLVTALSNGNYVASSGFWDNGPIQNAGHVTLCNGTLGCVGNVTTANSFFGTQANDAVGGQTLVTPLQNGAYVIRSSVWDNGAIADAGAITLCPAMGCDGLSPSPANSLVGSTANDMVGTDFGAFGLIALPDGNYLVRSTNWDNGGTADAGAISLGFGTGGTVGSLTVNNSVRGTAATFGYSLNFSYHPPTDQLVVSRPNDNIVTVFRPIAPTSATVPVAGRVTTAAGFGIGGVGVTLSDSSGNRRLAITSPFGYYRFDDVAVGENYVLSVAHKRYSFNPPSRPFTVTDEITDADFVATP